MATWAWQSLRSSNSTVAAASTANEGRHTGKRVLVILWIAAIAAIILMGLSGTPGWDARICLKTIQSVRSGVDPFAAAMAKQQALGDDGAARQQNARSLYAYSPMTLPLLRALAVLPGWLLMVLFATAAATGLLLQLRAGYLVADERERSWLIYLLPAVAFFPGLITDDAVLSGNLAYILYGLILTAAVSGCKRNRWLWFYFAVLAASTFKLPLLTLLAFPVLVGRRQFFTAASAAATGLLIFATQLWLWPNLLHEYLATIKMMFDFGHDFGYGPVGVVGELLWNQGQPYSEATTLTYLVFAGMIGLILLFFARQMRNENSSHDAWIPIALVGTFLLNPRIMKYDMAAITIPMLLIAWRGLRAALQSVGSSDAVENSRSSRAPIFIAAGSFLLLNLLTVFGPAWLPVELVVLLSVFTLGVRSLVRPEVEIQPASVPLAADLLTLAVPEEI